MWIFLFAPALITMLTVLPVSRYDLIDGMPMRQQEMIQKGATE